MPAGGAGGAGRFEFEPADGCPEYPEVEINASGRPSTGKQAYGEVSGLIEGHIHGMAYEFLGGRAHCGRPWHRFGAPYALRDCPDHELGHGCAAVLENVLYGDPARCHDPVGWPTFAEWPDYKSLTHEQTYWRWLERAWRGGLRVYVNLFVENRILCQVYPYKQNSCNEMDSVLLQAQRIRELQDYIDAQYGGPGKGFFRIVSNPYRGPQGDQPGQARRGPGDGGLGAVRVRAARTASRPATTPRSTTGSTACTSSGCASSRSRTSSTTRSPGSPATTARPGRSSTAPTSSPRASSGT